MSLDLTDSRNPVDVDLLARVRIALGLRRRTTFRSLHVEVVNRVAILSGQVPYFYDRQLAVETVRRVAGLTAVRDRIAVAGEPADSPGGILIRARSPRDELTPPADPSSVDASSPRQPSAARLVPRPAIWLLAVAVLAGCSAEPGDRVPVFPVSGQITLQGKPLADAFVVLHPRRPADMRTMTARGVTDREGRFQLTTYEAHDGAAAGEYAVTVQYYKLVKQGESYIAGPNVLPARIGDAATSDIIVRVATAPTQLQPIEIQR